MHSKVGIFCHAFPWIYLKRIFFHRRYSSADLDFLFNALESGLLSQVEPQAKAPGSGCVGEL
jgi:hypothetical protein